MIVDTSNIPNPRMTMSQELKFTRPETDLYVGQILKTVVMKEIANNQVLININGENINAQTSHKLKVGEHLAMQVVKTEHGEVILRPVKLSANQSQIEMALAREMPKQAPATHLLASLNTVQNSEKIPIDIQQQIKAILSSFISLPELSTKLAAAIAHSGIFCEYNLLKKEKEKSNFKDFKGLCLQLLDGLVKSGAKKGSAIAKNYQDGELGLPQQQGMPKPFAKPFTDIDLNQFKSPLLLNFLAEQVEETLARIKTEQLLHLTKSDELGFELRLSLPLQTNTGFEVLPLVIKQEVKDSKSATEEGWSIAFALHLEHLGALQAKLKLVGKAISVHLNAANNQTIEILSANRDAFDGLLSNIGLHLHCFSTQLGLEEEKGNQGNLRLLDIKI